MLFNDDSWYLIVKFFGFMSVLLLFVIYHFSKILVKDAFIPSKRRLVSHSRFGFVMFDYHVAADIAIQKANGLLVDNKVLEEPRSPPSIRKSQFIRRSFEINRSRGHVSFAGQRSFVDILQGVKTNTSTKVTEEGNCWLYGSVIICFNTEYSILNVSETLKEKGLEHILVRKGGGRDGILTFNSQDELKSNIGNLKDWFKDLSQFVVEWKIRVATSTMEAITKPLTMECKGKAHTIFVREDHLPNLSSMKHNGMYESSLLETCCSVKEANFPAIEGRKMGEDDEVAEASAMFGAEIACTHEKTQGKHPTDTVVEETPYDGGDIKGGRACIEKPLMDLMDNAGGGPGINLEVDLAHFAKQHVITRSPFRPIQPNVVSPEGTGIVPISHTELHYSGPLSNIGPYRKSNLSHPQTIQDSIFASTTNQ
ncbi:hypothetical protein CsSME_00012472 [Camellia sinensis var. sinensis]